MDSDNRKQRKMNISLTPPLEKEKNTQNVEKTPKAHKPPPIVKSFIKNINVLYTIVQNFANAQTKV